MKKILAILAISFGLSIPAHTAQAAWYGRYEVLSDSYTCITMWDHIDQYGKPYGQSAVKCSGVFPTYIDWDMACWPNGYKLQYSPRGRWIPEIDNTSDNCHKFSTYSDVIMRTLRD